MPQESLDFSVSNSSMNEEVQDTVLKKAGEAFRWMTAPAVILNGEFVTWNKNIQCVVPLDGEAPHSLRWFKPERAASGEQSASFELVYVNASLFQLEYGNQFVELNLNNEPLNVEASIWSRVGQAPENDVQRKWMHHYTKTLLSHRGHPCLVEYYAHTLVGNEHRFIGPAYNAFSLQEWMMKFEGFLEPDWAMAFGKSVFIQLMFALYELHRTGSYYGEPIMASDIRMTSEGNVVLPNALGERFVAGTYISPNRRNTQKPDIASLMQLVFSIVTRQKWQTVKEVNSKDVTTDNFQGDDAFRQVFVTVLQHPEYCALDILNLLSDEGLIDTCQASGLKWRDAYQRWLDIGTMPIIGTDMQHQAYLSLVSDATSSSRLFLKNNLAYFLSKEGALTASTFNWFILKQLSPSVSEIRPSCAGKKAFPSFLDNSYCMKHVRNDNVSFTKNIGAIVALHHPNINRPICVERSNEKITLMLRYANKGSLKQVMTQVASGEMSRFLFGVTVQVLNAMVMIDFGYDIRSAPPFLSADNILLDSEGVVLFTGLITNKSKFNPSTVTIGEYMQHLSKTLLALIPQEMNLPEFKEYVTSFEKTTPYQALLDSRVSEYFKACADDWPSVSKLKRLGINGQSLPDLISSWKSWQNGNLTNKKKSDACSIMQELFRTVQANAINTVRDALGTLSLDAFSRMTLAREKNEQNMSRPVLWQRGAKVIADVPFLWSQDSPIFTPKNGVWHWDKQVRCILPSAEKCSPSLIWFRLEETEQQEIPLFTKTRFELVYITASPLQLGRHSYSSPEGRVEASLWMRSGTSSTNDVAADSNRSANVKALLRKKSHPCLVEYYGHDFVDGEHRFLGQAFNGWSLKTWVTKLKDALSSELAINFGKAVFVHLMFALYELHREGSFYGEAILPEDVRMNSDGDVAILNAHGEQLVAGIPITLSDNPQRQDILSVIKLTYYIITNEAWNEINEVTVGKVNKRIPGGDLFKYGLIQILERPELSVIEILQLLSTCNITGKCEAAGLSWKEAHQLWLEKEENNYLMTKNESHQHRDIYLSSINDALRPSRTFIKSIIVPMLHHKKAVASSESEWTVLNELSSSVKTVQFHDEILKRFKIDSSNTIGCVKVIPFDEKNRNVHPVRRAVTILDRSHHPHIIKMLAATRQNTQVHIVMSFAKGDSLEKIVKQEQVPLECLEEFLFAVTVQVLQAFVFLHERLNTAHQDITADNIVFSDEGHVKLIGFAANRQITNTATDMQQLSRTMLELTPEKSEMRSFREFATSLAKMKAEEALHDSKLKYFFTPFKQKSLEECSKAIGQELVSLKSLNITGDTLSSLMKSWKAWEEIKANAESETRHFVRYKIKEIVLNTETVSIFVIKSRLTKIIHASTTEALSKQKVSSSTHTVLQKGAAITKDDLFFWMPEDASMCRFNLDEFDLNNQMGCVIPSCDDTPQSLIHFKLPRKDVQTLKRALFDQSKFEQVYLRSRPSPIEDLSNAPADVIKRPDREASIWVREGIPFNTDTDKEARSEHVSALLKKRGHPNILEYYAHATIGSEHRFIGQAFNCWSIDALMDKLVLSPDVASKFGEAVFIQLLFALYELHQSGGFYGEPLLPSDIRMNSEGNVAIPDARSERLVAGTEMAFSQSPERYDILSLVKLVYSIVAQQKWETLDKWTPRDIKNNLSIAENNVLIHLLQRVIEDQNMRVLDIVELLIGSRLLGLFPPSAFAMSKQYRNEYLSVVHNALRPSQRFIKTELVMMLTNPGNIVVSSDENWKVLKQMSPNVSLVQFHDSMMRCLQLSSKNELGFVVKKILTNNATVESTNALNRALSITKHCHHPNLISTLRVMHQGSSVNIVMEYASRQSLRAILVHLPEESMVDFLFAVAVQILNALLFLHIKLSEEHQDISIDNIVVASDGFVKLIGFGASGKILSDARSDMEQLSMMLLSLITSIPNTEATLKLREFATRIAEISPYEALCLPEVCSLFNTRYDPLSARELHSLKQNLNIEGATLPELIASWRMWETDTKASSSYTEKVSICIRTIVSRMENPAVAVINRIYEIVRENIEKSLAALQRAEQTQLARQENFIPATGEESINPYTLFPLPVQKSGLVQKPSNGLCP